MRNRLPGNGTISSGGKIINNGNKTNKSGHEQEALLELYNALALEKNSTVCIIAASIINVGVDKYIFTSLSLSEFSHSW